MGKLSRGDLLPGDRPASASSASADLIRQLQLLEAPGVNTLLAGEQPIVWDEALGANVLDVDGRVFVDLTSGFGVASVGHRHPAVVRAIASQSERLLHGLGDVAAHPARIELAQRLVDLAPVDDAQVYFAISGSDAVEIALKTALLSTGRARVLSFEGGYHGLTLGALATTSRPDFREPFLARLTPWVQRLPFGADMVSIRAALPDCGAVLVEPILGREGVVLPPANWLRDLAHCARDAGVLLIADEIFTGFGRTGRWFAVDHDAVRPDVLVVGKALGGGLPIAAVVASRSVFAAWQRGGEALHTATFLAHPLACAAALATLTALEHEGLVARAAHLGAQIASRTAHWVAFKGVRAVRGRGLLWGIEMNQPASATALQSSLRESGVLALRSGSQGTVLQIVPPFTISDAQLDYCLDTIERLLRHSAAP